MQSHPNPSPLFSVVIPVYNGEDFVDEAIQSVLDQTLDPGDVEIIVVNDGSEDSTASIIDGYASRYERVSALHQPNGGVSVALNTGVDAAQGTYIGFLGSDDRLSENTLEAVGAFFEEHEDECDLVAIPLMMFGARSGPHWNNRNRFATTRVIDVSREWNRPQAAGGGTFVKARVLREAGLRFDPRLFISEDQTLNTQVIQRKMAYGVVAEATYFNRRHRVGGSLVSSSQFRTEFYTDVPRYAYQRMLDAGREMYGYVPRYVQAMVTYDLSWRFRADLSDMDPELDSGYRDLLSSLLQQIDIRVIMAANAPIEVRLSMLAVRAGTPIRDLVQRRGTTYYVEDMPVYSLEAKPRARHRPARCDIEFFEVRGDQVLVDGVFRVPDIDDWELLLEVGGRRYPVERVEDPRPVRASYGNEIAASVSFHAQVELRAGESLAFVVLAGQTPSEAGVAVPVEPRMHRYTGFSGRADAFYYRRMGRTVFRRQRLSIERVDLGVRGILRAEAGFFRRAARAGAPARVLATRAGAIARRAVRRRDIWLMADHKSEAGDNAEAMFRHLCAHPREGVVPYFVLRKDAKEYAELRRLGRVVVPGSRAHLRAYLDAAVVMNSAADNYMLDPLGRPRTFLNDLVSHRSVFLQHGVTLHDQSAWLNRRAKGFDLFVTSSPAERESVIHGNYGYGPDQVVLTGMPRFDRLVSRPDRLLVIAPTWRKALSGVLDPETGRVGKSERFAESSYFEFWQSVVSDPGLNAAMAELGFTGTLALHPSHSAEHSTFVPSERISINAYPHDYRDLFRRGSVLVTDYSSVAFDFAYLRKPVVYAQGDREEFYDSHLYSEGYFSFDEDGFGPVVTTVPALVESLVSLLASSCEMEAEYRERADRFFAFAGGGNSERLCRAIESSLNRDPLPLHHRSPAVALGR